MRPALDQAALLELVDDRDHAAGRRPDRLADRLLGAALGGVDHVQDPEQRRLEVGLGDPLGEAPRGVDPDLGEQKGEAEEGARSPAMRFVMPCVESLTELISARNDFLLETFHP